jgi:hypothetical protein
MANHIANRDTIVKNLKEELIGPCPSGQEIDCTQPIAFDDPGRSYGPWRQFGTGEEILLRDTPTKRYGIGVLYPLGTTAVDDDVQGLVQNLETSFDDGATSSAGNGYVDTGISEEAIQQTEEIGRRSTPKSDESDDFDISAANAYRQSSMGVSFLVELPAGSVLVVQATGGRYRRKEVKVAGKERIWWLRTPVTLRAEFTADALCTSAAQMVKATGASGEELEGLNLVVEVFSRPRPNARQRLVTVCLVNRKLASIGSDQFCLFQSFFKASVHAPGEQPHILPYPGAQIKQLDEEEESLELLYRNAQTFGAGHGCAANWGIGSGPREAGSIEYSSLESDNGETIQGRVSWVSAECFPIIETPGMTPNITRKDGSQLEVSMATLAGLVPEENGFASLREVVALYEEWIEEKRAAVSTLDRAYQAVALRNIENCRRSAQRMRDGLAYLEGNPQAFQAFQLTNEAILLQQVCSRRELRKARYDASSYRLQFSEPYNEPNPQNILSGRGNWRAFQIAFLLMAIQSCADGRALDREIVELIWFPTGGGKTEAYLGLAAFGMFMQRLENPEDAGVHVLMRYTLRLLTAQQFQRAAGLLCAMEYLRRRQRTKLGDKEFSIGIWLGGTTTPNTRKNALAVLGKLASGDKFTENLFIISRCPWCGAQLGPLQYSGKAPRNAPRVIGYERRGETVVFACPDRQCPFSDNLPVYVIDEDVYERRPSMVIGTVDKFAMLALQPRARALFGLNKDGQRICSPPNLIIQDELHLISGPLGSMVGLYEGLIEELCTDKRQKDSIPPKIVTSTATIRRYTDQVKALYARSDVALFPPPGLAAGDSFFARYDRLPNGKLRRGRMYVGIHAPGLGSIQTAQVRTCAALLQAPVPLSAEERDPWWTLLLFFNSLRELGTTVSLFQSDIPDYLKVLRNRLGIDPNHLRWLNNILELTGRLKSDELPEAITALEVTTSRSSDRSIDVCLASNIIEVGIDIDRLSLMTVVGQPKTTSQYIQVTGRVGRRTQERPGLIAMIYSASKPRDRSHFEKFRSYHERLYAQVEPTSVTPFSPPALDRALHAVMVAYTRLVGDRTVAERPTPYPSALIDTFKRIILARVSSVDPEERANVERVFGRRANEWRRWERLHWDVPAQDSEIPMLRMAGSYVSRERERLSWAIPTSMRNVDAECEGVITQLYLQDEEQDNG